MAVFALKDVGIEEFLNGVVQTYPNPAQEWISLCFDLEKPCFVQVGLFDVSGAELLRIYNGALEVGLFERQINTSELPSGIYYLTIMINGHHHLESIIIE